MLTRISRSFSTLIGKQAPRFSATACMPDDSFKKVSLDDYRGKYVVLYFWPADFTFVCASETIDFHKKLAEFQHRGAEVLGCSIDTEHVHKAWKAVGKAQGGLGTAINHAMISDVTKDIAKNYGVLLEDIGVTVRGVFVIDKEGKVRSEMKNDLPLGRNVDEVLRVLDAVVFTDSAQGEVCPSGWKPGKPSMKPTTQGVAEYLTKYT
jgi:alkyl hydroperoxide reductase subunit AhpC